MGARVRAVSVVVQLEVVLDDGDTLTPLQVDPVRIPATALAQFDLAEQLEQLQKQVDAQR